MIKTFLRIRQNFFSGKYQKYKVTRLPGEEFVTFLPDQASLSELLYHIKFNFQTENELMAAGAFTSDLSTFPVNEEMKRINEQINNSPFLPLLIANELYIYEVKQEKAHLIYGLQVLELNITNNRNLPQNMQAAISQLSYDWQNAKTVADIMKMPHLPSSKDPEVQEEREHLEEAIGKAAGTIEAMNGLKMQDPLKEFVKKMTLIMGSNWVFLYIITFGYYGWDVGEPISYLTGVGVDLLALLRVFELQDRIQSEIAMNEGRWMGLLNLYSHKNRQRWLHRYLRRQIN